MSGTLHIAFDRGTLRIDTPSPDDYMGVMWDPRTRGYRAAAFRYGDIVRQAKELGHVLHSSISERWVEETHAWQRPSLRPYQEDAIEAWNRLNRRALLVMPTGSGKTRTAIAAMADVRAPSLVVCPTRALLHHWREAISGYYARPVGILGDGDNKPANVTVMTFESAYRHLDTLGDRFALVVVDEAHHFSGGGRREALEMCAAPMRLGLTATAPEPSTAGADRLTELIGPTACEIALHDLVGKHLAHYQIIRLRVQLSHEERDLHDRWHLPFSEMRSAFSRAHPAADWTSLVREIGRTREGRKAMALYQKDVQLALFPAAKQALTESLLTRHIRDKTIVFTALVDHAYTIGLDNLIHVITADTPSSERELVLSKFKDGRVRAIASARVLNEGIDVPDANVAILVGGTLGKREHIQRIGRVLRPAVDKVARVYILTTANSIDDRRSESLRRKLAPHRSSHLSTSRTFHFDPLPHTSR